jgi:hypothetical protein
VSGFTSPTRRSKGKNIFSVVVDREAFQVWIGFAFVVAVQTGGRIGGTHAGAVDAQCELRRMKHFVDDLLSQCRLELVEEIAGSVGETAAESENLLELVGWNELDGVCRRCRCGGGLPLGPFPVADARVLPNCEAAGCWNGIGTWPC